MRRTSRRRPGRAAPAFLMVDLLMAVAIAGALILSLGVAVGTFRRAERRMTDTRAANRRLEQALLTLQAGGTADPELQIERLTNGPGNRVWVRLAVRQGAPGGQPVGVEPPREMDNRPGGPPLRATLVGLVPADKAPGGVP
jgi:hypothetical protein